MVSDLFCYVRGHGFNSLGLQKFQNIFEVLPNTATSASWGPPLPRHQWWGPHSHVINGGAHMWDPQSHVSNSGAHLPRQQKRAHVWDPPATSTVVEPTRGTHHGHVSSSGAHMWDPHYHVSSSGAHMWDPPSMSAVVGQQVWDPNVGATN